MPKPSKIPALLTLPREQQEALTKWLMEERATYDEARKRLAVQFGVKATDSALSVFWARVCEPKRWAEQRRSENEQREGRLLLQITVRARFDNTLEITVGGPAAATTETKTL